MLIFTADLEEVEEVCGGCVDPDEVLVCGGCGVGEGSDGEVLGTGDVRFYFDGFHFLSEV